MNQRQYKIEFIPNIETWAQIDGYDNYQVSQFGRIRNSKTGKILKGFTTDKGYIKVELYNNDGRKRIFVHRLVANTFLENPLNKNFVDHIDGNRANNNISNLRFATHLENCSNLKKREGGTSKYKGVCFAKDKKMWRVELTCKNKRFFVGYYKNEHEAGMAYDEKAKELYGEFAKLNFEE